MKSSEPKFFKTLLGKEKRPKNGVKLGEKKNMNLPGATVDLPTLTEKDEKDLVDFGIE